MDIFGFHERGLEFVPASHERISGEGYTARLRLTTRATSISELTLSQSETKPSGLHHHTGISLAVYASWRTTMLYRDQLMLASLKVTHAFTIFPRGDPSRWRVEPALILSSLSISTLVVRPSEPEAAGHSPPAQR